MEDYSPASRVMDRAAYHEAHRTEPDYWIRKAETALHWGSSERVAEYLAMARYYRDGETT